jgi:putative FmdB family regulatory protein
VDNRVALALRLRGGGARRAVSRPLTLAGPDVRKILSEVELPLYEYACPKHGTFERMQKFSDAPVTACPVCGGPVEKLLSAPAIQFKGTGWYVTDYARKSSGEGKEKGASKESAKEASTSTETKSTSSEAKSTSSGTHKK